MNTIILITHMAPMRTLYMSMGQENRILLKLRTTNMPDIIRRIF